MKPLNPIRSACRRAHSIVVRALPLVLVCGAATVAHAAVRHEGTWPETDKAISLDVSGVSRAEAVRRLADAAGWSVVMSAPGADQPVDLHIKNQPASKVLDLVLSEGAWIAKRDGTLLSIAHDDEHMAAHLDPSRGAPVALPDLAHMGEHAAAEPPEPPEPPEAPEAAEAPAPPSPPSTHEKHGRHGEDRVITGGHVTIEKGESVADVTVLGGSLDVIGEVNGDLAVFGGNVVIHEGALVHGDAAVIGGSLRVDDGATVDGDVGVVGGSLKRGSKAKIGGEARDSKGELKVNVGVDDDDESDAHAKASDLSAKARVSRLFGKVGSAITMNAFLFILGAILLALGTDRMDLLKTEVAARPMRSFALGVVGAIAAVILAVMLCVTLVGIPVLLVGILAGAVALYAGMTAVLTTAGQAVLGHKTKNPYIHLAAGCFMSLVLGGLPKIGHIVWLAIAFIAIGTLVATRCAGFIPVRTRKPTSNDPYRTAAG